MTCEIIIFVLLLLFPSYSSSRRILHQPFFPVADYPPPSQPSPISDAQPPSPSPQPQSQPQPKYPFSSLSPPDPVHHHHNHHPFFPFYTSPPSYTTTVPSTSLPTFPANITSITIPSSSSSRSHFSKKLLFLSLTLTLLSIACIAAVLASLLYHRNHHDKKPPASDSLRLFPANLPTSDKPPPPPTLPPNFSTPSSEFLYLGTLVSPLHDHKHKISDTHAASSTTVDYASLGSPELHPLPPLPRQDFHHQRNLQDEDFFSPKDSPVVFQRHSKISSPPPPPLQPPPPPPPTGFCDIERKQEISKPKLKALHWDKVRASSKVTVWDRLKFSSFQVDEEMIETLFMANSSKNHRTNEPMVGPTVAEDVNQKNNRILDPLKSRNIAILLRAFNLTIEEVCESISQGNVDTLGSELLGSLLKMAPTTEEEARLKKFDESCLIELDPSEKFLKSVITIPFAFKRIDAMLYISNFDTEIDYLHGSFEIIETACRELRSSRMFIKLLEAVLMAGNRMNTGTNRGDANAFKLDTLLKLVDVKGTDGKTTLLHFVVQEITKVEGCRLAGTNLDLAGRVKQQSELCDEVEFTKRGLEVVSRLGGELSNVKKAAAMDFDMLSKEVRRLAIGLLKIREVVSLNEEIGSNTRFSDSMNEFLKKAEHDIEKVEGEERLTVSMVKETTEYYHGNSSMDEAQPLRIFMVVRDFLTVLDRVCKEVGKLNERTAVGRGCGREYALPMKDRVLSSGFPKFIERQHFGSSDGEDDSSPI